MAIGVYKRKKWAERIKLNCSQCDCLLIKIKSQVNSKFSFCNKSCKGKFFALKDNYIPPSREGFSGEKSPVWIKDRSLLKRFNEDRKDRRSSAYNYWRMEVYKRDGFKCQIADIDCSGRIEAHHILGWIEYPKLRFNIKNGITLCHAHHPRKRAEEKRLIPTFLDLVSVSRE